MPRSSLPFLLALIAAVRADDVAADTFNFLAIGDCEPTTHDLFFCEAAMHTLHAERRS